MVQVTTRRVVADLPLGARGDEVAGDDRHVALPPLPFPHVVHVARITERALLLLRDPYVQPSLRLHVVGHTDNVGALAHNMTLSKQRAEAVVNALVTNYQIAAARLIANGVGPLAPVASNAAEEGRAKNRRVELVAQ